MVTGAGRVLVESLRIEAVMPQASRPRTHRPRTAPPITIKTRSVIRVWVSVQTATKPERAEFPVGRECRVREGKNGLQTGAGTASASL